MAMEALLAVLKSNARCDWQWNLFQEFVACTFPKYNFELLLSHPSRSRGLLDEEESAILTSS
jgi:hypothetical protein